MSLRDHLNCQSNEEWSRKITGKPESIPITRESLMFHSGHSKQRSVFAHMYPFLLYSKFRLKLPHTLTTSKTYCLGTHFPTHIHPTYAFQNVFMTGLISLKTHCLQNKTQSLSFRTLIPDSTYIFFLFHANLKSTTKCKQLPHKSCSLFFLV